MLVVGFVLAAAGLFYVKTHPLVFNESFFSHAHCIANTGMALNIHAADHGGAFPVHTNGYGDALLMLTNEVGYLPALTGPGFSAAPFQEARDAGGNVDEQRCGRVYVQGLREDMDGDIALLFDKLPTPGGDHCHLWHRLRAPLGREIWQLSGGHSFVPLSHWPAFASNQVNLLVKAGTSRAEAERLYSEELETWR